MTTSKWDFKAVSRSLPAPHLINLSPEQMARIGAYERVLEIAAATQVPKPIFSKYFVKAAVGRPNGNILPAGNIEYGLCQALHGEESAANAFRIRYGNADPRHAILGFSGREPGNIPRCCGNCRDIMRDILGPELEIVTGAPNGGIATVMPLRECLLDDFSPCAVDGDIEFAAKDVLDQAMPLENDIYSPPGIHPRRKYYAYLLTRTADAYAGALDLGCEYHPIYPLRDAVRQARRANDPFIISAYIVCVQRDPALLGQPPDVMYKDRQHLLEMVIQAELVRDDPSWDAKVTLITCDGRVCGEPSDGGEIRVTGAWETTAREWLPFPFTLHAFGEEFVAMARAKYKKRLGMES